MAYRKEFLKKLEDLRDTHLPPPPRSDERAATPHADAETRKNLVLISHDESIFNTNEGQTWIWGTADQPYIQPKTKGSGIMVNDFITQQRGFLFLNDQEYAVARALDPGFPRTARAFLEYGGELLDGREIHGECKRRSYHRGVSFPS